MTVTVVKVGKTVFQSALPVRAAIKSQEKGLRRSMFQSALPVRAAIFAVHRQVKLFKCFNPRCP